MILDRMKICPRHLAFSVASEKPVQDHKEEWLKFGLWIFWLKRFAACPTSKGGCSRLFMSGPAMIKVDPTGMIHQSQFRKAWNATKKNSVHFQFQEWSSSNSDSKGICLTWDPGMANCSLSSTEASAGQKDTACGNLEASPKNTCLTKKRSCLTSYFSDRPWKEDQIAVMMCWKCPLNHWDASFGMFLFNLIYLNLSDILEMFCTKPIITIPTTSMNVKNATLTLFPWTSITSATSSCPLAEHRWLDEFDLRLEPVLRWHKLGETLMGV